MELHTIRMLKTLVMSSSFLMVGMGMMVVGPTLLDLSLQTHESLAVVSTCITVRAVGYIAGAVIMGAAFPHTNFQLFAAASLFVCGVTAIAVPLVTNIWILLPIFGVSGVFLSCYETGGYLFASHVWGSRSSTVFQVVTFMYGVGGLLSPVLVRPFLTQVAAEGEVGEAVPGDGDEEEVLLIYPYSVMGGLFLVNSLLNFLLWCFFPQTPPYDQESEEEARVTWDRKTLTVTATAAILMFNYYGLEIAMGSFLLTYAVNSDLHLSKKTGADLTTLFWASYTLPKLLSAVIVERIGNRVLITVCIVVLMIGNVIMWLLAQDDQNWLWVGVAVLGIGISSIWGSMFAFVGELIGLSSTVGSILIFCAVAGDFVIPFIIALQIEQNNQVFLWTILSCSSIVSVLFFSLVPVKNRTTQSDA